MATCMYPAFCLISTLIHYRLRRFRRVAAEGFSKSAVQHFHPIQNREAIMLALAMIKSPPNSGEAFSQTRIVYHVVRQLPPSASRVRG
jgi:hypothetical protein